ncbi:MAG: hypothetical protein JXA66_01140, partial [Oligoflexia bacterium]|nr:hypothetical protein [Oligoflexia bacterium]
LNLEISVLKNRYQPDMILGITTEAIRKAKNGQKVIEEIKEKTGIGFKIISGHEEAVFTFNAVKNLINSEHAIVADIGGGSSELVTTNNGNIIKTESIPIGAVKIQENFDLFTKGNVNIEEAAEFITAWFNHLPRKTGLLILCGGTATTIGSLLRQQQTYRPAEIEGMQIDIGEFNSVLNRLLCSKPEEIITLIPDVKRTDIITAGVTITKTLIDIVNPVKITVSTLGPRHGYLKEFFDFTWIKYC